MTDVKWYDLHIEVGTVTLQSSGNKYPYARTVLGSAGIEFENVSQTMATAICSVFADMSKFGVYGSLRKDPKYSQFPIVPSRDPYRQTDYYLHIEVGESDKFDVYVKTRFLTGEEYETRCPAGNLPLVSDMIYDVIMEMESFGMLETLKNSPLVSTFPLPTPSASISAKATSSPQKKSDIVRQLPSHIIDIPHPQCQDHCTSWDIFGKGKCPNMCESRFK